MNKILLINRMGIGDVVLTTPLAQLIKEQCPDCRIGMLVAAKAGDIIRNHPYIDDVYCYSRQTKRQLIQEIRRRQYTQAIIIDERLTSSWLAWRAGCRLLNFGKIVTMGKMHFGHRPRWDACRAVIRYSTYLRCLQPGAAIAELSPTIGRPDSEHELAVEQWLSRHDLQQRPFVLIVAKGIASNKNWPPEHLGSLNMLLEQRGIAAVYLGSGGDRDYIERISGPKIIAVGTFSLRQLPLLAQHALATVTPCTGAMHVIATAKRPIIALYGPTNPAEWAPLYAQVLAAGAACAPCNKLVCDNEIDCQCMQAIQPEQVVALVDNYLQ